LSDLNCSNLKIFVVDMVFLEVWVNLNRNPMEEIYRVIQESRCGREDPFLDCLQKVTVRRISVGCLVMKTFIANKADASSGKPSARASADFACFTQDPLTCSHSGVKTARKIHFMGVRNPK
jgi:hypothetical protein